MCLGLSEAPAGSSQALGQTIEMTPMKVNAWPGFVLSEQGWSIFADARPQLVLPLPAAALHGPWGRPGRCASPQLRRGLHQTPPKVAALSPKARLLWHHQDCTTDRQPGDGPDITLQGSTVSSR